MDRRPGRAVLVLHAGFNTLGFIFDAALRVDVNAAYDRSAGVGDLTTLLPGLIAVLAAVVVWQRTRRTGPARTTADAEARVEAEPVSHPSAG
ncbi:MULTISPECIES: hypothetical protein [unclassified Microbacterium]|uniref:hypothetical protein n=1 Tax=unclassified Microbacterium TaxID=2609290 RepID=UPI00214B11C9|nr:MULTISPECIES: hypothetical protein [unclassified Microbacterium]MCR2784163.1 hypothetical protein [Microbacterium sp. zg.B96]WIM15003.1 hypothetical protein QNO11_10620 [Microbacterium sp. zg-B96]